MKILLDLQGQTASRHRGIGRYSLSLAQAIVRNRGQHQIILLANGAFGEQLHELRSHFDLSEGEVDFVVFDADFPVAEIDPVNEASCRLAEITRERFIEQLKPDVVLLTSLFEGFLDDAVTSIGTSGSGPLSAVVLYDLIPFLSPDPYWPKEYQPYYDRKIESLKRADLLLSISDYARKEASAAIPELADKIINMSSACGSDFCQKTISDFRKNEIFSRYGIRENFIMSAGNIESRKNFELIVKAFGRLPVELRQGRQIVLVGSANDERMLAELRNLAEVAGLSDKDLIITGHAPDEDLKDLYCLCELFVFPSRHEGFGLPPLEAMSCGAAVLGSNATSVPEVIGRPEAMFSPDSESELADLLYKVLTDAGFMSALKTQGLAQAKNFSWDKTAIAAINALVHLKEQKHSDCFELQTEQSGIRPRLAMVTPLPPEQTGIATYVAELLPELSKTYEITVISDQAEVSDKAKNAVSAVRSISWFEKNAKQFARIVYQMGNSPFHVHMLDLMHRFPGVVVLHDFYLSALKAWMEITGYQPGSFTSSLLYSHGYQALHQYASEGLEPAKFRWPCSLDVVNAALGLVLNSKYSHKLVREYYGEQYDEKITVTKLNRESVVSKERVAARQRLGLSDDCFVVCSFGFMDPTKLNHALLEAWAASRLANNQKCRLVFVGCRHGGEYGAKLDSLIASIDGGKRISITGFASSDIYDDYLAAADIGVQLRTLSRGETSGTVLDCLAHGLPVIINANGSMAEYPDNILIKLSDEFELNDLVLALERLQEDANFRQTLATAGVEYLKSHHAPEISAAGYIEAIERVAENKNLQSIAQAKREFWAKLPNLTLEQRADTAERIESIRPTIYVDISATARNDLRTGIERVTRALLQEMLMAPPIGYDVKPVYLVEEKGRWRVKLANTYLSKQVGYSLVKPEDRVVIPCQGDILIALDLFSDGVISASNKGLYDYWRRSGAKIGFMVYDILPITHPHCFPEWAKPTHEQWTRTITHEADFLVCISNHVKSEITKWMSKNGIPLDRQPCVDYVHLGADVDASFPTKGFPDGAQQVLHRLKVRPTFLMVGTIEPRKGHLSVLQAFDSLWKSGVDINLVIVGYEGWKPLPQHERRTIPETIAMLNGSSELNKRLFWLEGISDEYLEAVYASASALIAASEDEGFGLPLIEAAQHGLPIIARDIPVFREVAGNNAFYFTDTSVDVIAASLHIWLDLFNKSLHPSSKNLRWLSWRECATNLLSVII